MALDRYSIYYDKEFVKFLDFWNGEVEKKLLRQSKECGVYSVIKKVLNPNSKSHWEKELYKHYRRLLDELTVNYDRIVDFSVGKLINRKICVKTALKSKRHLSQLLIFYILQRSRIDDSKFRQVFVAMDKELFKGRRIRNFCYEKWGFVKLFFS